MSSVAGPTDGKPTGARLDRLRPADHPTIRMLFFRYAAPVVAIVATCATGTVPAASSPLPPVAARVFFYGDIGNAVNSPYRHNPLLVRPRTIFLTEDGSVALTDLRWTGWGSPIARASGLWSASSCTPNCASGKRTNEAAQLTLSGPVRLLGHRVYRCFSVHVPDHPQADVRECLKRQGGFYVYTPTPAPAAHRTHRGSIINGSNIRKLPPPQT